MMITNDIYWRKKSVYEFKNARRLSEMMRINRKPRYLESSILNGYSIQSKENNFFLNLPGIR